MKELNDLAKQVITAYSRLGLTLGFCESVTGGLISHIITNQDGSSRVFGGSLVAYSALAKSILLDIPLDFIYEEGTISQKMAETMVIQGGKKYPDIDVHIATTGIAGKSIEGLPRGLIFIGINFAGDIKTKKFMFEGTRQEIKEQTVLEAFKMLIHAIELMEKGS
ncbi:MAG: CinA family protein [Promethearchaeota archaeon]